MAASNGELRLTLFRPARTLAPYVSHYGLRKGGLEREEFLRPIYARTQQTLEFYLQDRYRLQTAEGQLTAPSVLLTGQSTSPKGKLIYPRTVCTLTVHFHPAGFHALFRLPMHLLADQALSADTLLGSSTSELLERLQSAVSEQQMVHILDAFLLHRARQTVLHSPIQHAARWLRCQHGVVDLAALAYGCNLSLRQFERQFREQVGISPKVFSRVARLEYAVQRKQHLPGLSLTAVSADAGYFDQAHFIRDARILAGTSPRRLIASLPDNDRIFFDSAAYRSRRSLKVDPCRICTILPNSYPLHLPPMTSDA